MLPLRLVIDTNVVISGALKPKGLERTALIFALTRPSLLFVSRPILDEYAEVLGRPELRIPAAERHALVDLITARAQAVTPHITIATCPDPDDNVFLECAQAVRADYLITGNLKHFPQYWHSTKIINAREFLSVIGPHLLT